MSSSFKISTGARNSILATGSVKGAFDNMVIRIYGNNASIPASADDAVGSATLLCVLSKGGLGEGVTFDGTPSSGVLSKSSTEEWLGTILANGTASFFRGSSLTDAGGLSIIESRMQGTVGLVNADFLVRDTLFVLGEEQRADSCNIGLPESE